MRFVNFASGSRGNCSLVSDGEINLLIDCGISFAKLKGELRKLALAVEDIHLVLVTHLHHDHFKPFPTWYEKTSLRFSFPEMVLPRIRAVAGGVKGNGRIVAFSAYNSLRLGSMSIAFFPLSHDAPETVGVSVQANGKSLAYLTDLGSYDQNLVSFLEGRDLIFLEANHETSLVKASFYPENVKRRILSPFGHLSNEQAIALLSQLRKPPSSLVFGHLSENNNSPNLLLERWERLPLVKGLSTVGIASQNSSTDITF